MFSIESDSNLMCTDNFEMQKVDGSMLLRVTEDFMQAHLRISHPLKRKRIARMIAQLKEHQTKYLKEKSLDDLDEYMMALESHRLQVNADTFMRTILLTGKLFSSLQN